MARCGQQAAHNAWATLRVAHMPTGPTATSHTLHESTRVHENGVQPPTLTRGGPKNGGRPPHLRTGPRPMHASRLGPMTCLLLATSRAPSSRTPDTCFAVVAVLDHAGRGAAGRPRRYTCRRCARSLSPPRARSGPAVGLLAERAAQLRECVTEAGARAVLAHIRPQPAGQLAAAVRSALEREHH